MFIFKDGLYICYGGEVRKLPMPNYIPLPPTVEWDNHTITINREYVEVDMLESRYIEDPEAEQDELDNIEVKNDPVILDEEVGEE